MTPAQLERLAMLAEEASELSAICMKAIRHGLDSQHPETRERNDDAIYRELMDVLVMAQLMMNAGDIPPIPSVEDYFNPKLIERKLKYTRHQ